MARARNLISSWSCTLLDAWGGIPIIGMVYLAVTLIILYPISLYPRTLLPVHAYDTYQHVWSLWWYRYALVSEGISPAQVTHLYAPNGIYFPMLWSWVLPHLIAVPMQALFGLIGTYNILLILSFPLNGVAMYLLARDITASRPGAFFAGLIWAFFPGKIIHLVGHYLQFHIYWLALYTLFLVRLVRRPTIRVAVGSGVTLAFTLLSHFLHAAYFAVPLTVLVIVVSLVSDWRHLLTARFVRSAGLALGLALIIVAPFYGPYLVDYFGDPARFIYSGGSAAFSSDILQLFVPSQFNPFVQRLPTLRSFAQSLIPSGGNAAESTNYLGWMALLCSGIGIAAYRRKTVCWWLVALTGALLSLGPVLRIAGQVVVVPHEQLSTLFRTPYDLLQQVPLFSIGRTPGRFGTLMMLGIALLAGCGIKRLWATSLSSKTKHALLGVISIVLLFEYLTWWPLPAFPTPVSPFYHHIRKEYLPGEVAILTFPLFYVRGSQVLAGANYDMINQTVHEQRIAGGYIHRWPAREKGRAIALDHILAPERGLDIFQIDQESDVAAILHQQGFQYIIVHKPITDDSPPDVAAQALGLAGFVAGAAEARVQAEERLTDLLGTPVYEDAILWAWRVPEVMPNSRASAIYLYAGRGWHDPLRFAEHTHRWMRDAEAELFVEQAQPGWGELSFQALAWTEGELMLSINGQPIERWRVDPGAQVVSTPPFYLSETSNRLVLHTSVSPPPGEYYRVRLSDMAFETLPEVGAVLSKPVALEGDMHLAALPGIGSQSAPGELFYLALAWRAEAEPMVDYKSYVHLVGSDGEIVAQDDPQPAAYALELPSTLASGTYRLYVGLYDPETLQRLDVMTQDAIADDYGLLIGSIEIN